MTDTDPDDDDRLDGVPDDAVIDRAVYDGTRELVDDAETDTTRRRLCQALAVLGATSLAGCEGVSTDSSDQRSGDASGTATPIPTAANIASLITAHVAQLEGKSYTVGIELQDAGSDPDIKKEIEYLRSASGRPLVSLTEVSTIDDGVESLTHFFAPDLHGVEIGFTNGSSNSAALNVASTVLEVTGASVFDKYLVGAAVAEPETKTATDTGETLESYAIHAHRRYDFDSGVVVVGPDGIIRRFALEWTDAGGVDRWVRAETYDIGSTSVDIPSL